MKFLYWFFAVYWIVWGIAAICGVVPTVMTIACGFFIAGLGFIGNALRE